MSMRVNKTTNLGRLPASFDEVVAHCTTLFTGVDQAVMRSKLLDCFDCPIFWITRDGRLLGCNKAALFVHAMKPDEYCGLSYRELARARGIDESVYQKFADDDQQAMQKGSPLLYIEDSPHVVPAGFFVPLSCRAPIFCPVTGEHLGGCGLTINVAAQVLSLKRALSPLDYAQLKFEQFVHEKNNRLDELVSDSMRALDSSNMEQRAALPRFAQSLVNFQRSFQRDAARTLSEGSCLLPGTFTPMDLFSRVQRMVDDGSQPPIRLVVESTSAWDDVAVHSHYAVLSQLVYDFVDNSARHSGCDEVVCRFRPCELAVPGKTAVTYYLLTVMDEGPGLCAAMQAYLMASNDNVPHPTGRTGLTLIKHAVHRMLHGRLFCETTRGGKVAIHVVFPASPPTLDITATRGGECHA